MFGRKKNPSSETYQQLEKYVKTQSAHVSTLPADEMLKVMYSGYALDAVDFVSKQYGHELDFGDESVRLIEEVLSDLYDQKKASQPSDEQVINFAKVFGAYVGTVFVERHGWQWQAAGQGPLDHLKVTVTDGKTHFLVIGKVYKRLQNGPEDNVWDACRIVLAQAEGHLKPRTTKRSKK